MPAAKMAISLPPDLFREMERIRKRRGMSRSAIIQTGLRACLRALRDDARVRRYVRAYRASPETDREVAEAAGWIRAAWGRR